MEGTGGLDARRAAVCVSCRVQVVYTDLCRDAAHFTPFDRRPARRRRHRDRAAGRDGRRAIARGRSRWPRRRSVCRGSHVKATAFIFTTTDCPVANRYAPEIRRLFDSYGRQGIRFWLVYVNARETPDAIRAHTKTYSLPLSVLRDREHELVRRLGVSVTPEVAMVDPRGTVIYRGRIDDRYTELGVDRPVATRHEFEDALAATVAGTPIATPNTRAVGCFIADFKPAKGSTRHFPRALDWLAVSPRRAPRALDRYANARHLQSSPAKPHSGPITFARDVAPIVFDKCASCHRPGGPAPFSLMTFADVRQRASQIVAVTERRYMPPWKADADPAGFVGQKRLSDDELATLRQWVAQGAPEGDRRDLPSQPAFAEGWQLGKPDLIVTLARAVRARRRADRRVSHLRHPVADRPRRSTSPASSSSRATRASCTMRISGSIRRAALA